MGLHSTHTHVINVTLQLSPCHSCGTRTHAAARPIAQCSGSDHWYCFTRFTVQTLSMLNAVHKQLQASHLADLLASSPLVLVYQLIGNVKSHQVASSMQKQLDAACSGGSGVQATCIKVKNTMGLFTPGVKFASYLKADNILVGWKVPSHGLLHQIKASRSTGIIDILSTSQASSTAQQQQSTGPKPQDQPVTGQQQHKSAQGSGAPGSVRIQGPKQARQRPEGPGLLAAPSIPHAVMVAAIQESLQLPKRLPVALLASFYKGQPIKLSHLQQWQALDESTVTAELLSELDAISSNLLQLEDNHGSMVDTMAAAAPMEELLFMLDTQAGPHDTQASESEASPATATT